MLPKCCLFVWITSVFVVLGDQQPTFDADLLLVDMAQYDQEFELLSSSIMNSLNAYGFFSIQNIPELDTNKLLSISQAFFQKDIEYKRNYAKCKWNASNPNCYRGYYPIIPGESSMKEAIEYGRHPSFLCDNCSFPEFVLYENDWNIYPDFPANFSQIFNSQYESLLNCATKVMRLISYGLYGNTIEKPINYFESMFLPYTLSTFRLMHSPPHPLYSSNECITSTPAHYDSGFITLVITFNRGLEAYNENENRWEQLPVEDNLVYVNVGRVLRNITANTLKATQHRVINHGESRFSAAFFFEPNYDTQIPTTANKTENYGEWLVEVDKQFIEYSDEPVGMCWWNKTIQNLNCLDPSGNEIPYYY